MMSVLCQKKKGKKNRGEKIETREMENNMKKAHLITQRFC